MALKQTLTKKKHAGNAFLNLLTKIIHLTKKGKIKLKYKKNVLPFKSVFLRKKKEWFYGKKNGVKKIF